MSSPTWWLRSFACPGFESRARRNFLMLPKWRKDQCVTICMFQTFNLKAPSSIFNVLHVLTFKKAICKPKGSLWVSRHSVTSEKKCVPCSSVCFSNILSRTLFFHEHCLLNHKQTLKLHLEWSHSQQILSPSYCAKCKNLKALFSGLKQ